MVRIVDWRHKKIRKCKDQKKHKIHIWPEQKKKISDVLIIKFSKIPSVHVDHLFFPYHCEPSILTLLRATSLLSKTPSICVDHLFYPSLHFFPTLLDKQEAAACWPLYFTLPCRLFLMSSKLSNKLPSDTCTKTTVINFSATLEGYQDQLLSATIHIVCASVLAMIIISCSLVLSSKDKAALLYSCHM